MNRPIITLRKPEPLPNYLQWVRQQPSVLSGISPCSAHHAIDVGHGGSKPSDLWTFPLTHDEHMELHQHGAPAWEYKHGSQLKFVAETLLKAFEDGVITVL